MHIAYNKTRPTVFLPPLCLDWELDLFSSCFSFHFQDYRHHSPFNPSLLFGIISRLILLSLSYTTVLP